MDTPDQASERDRITKLFDSGEIFDLPENQLRGILEHLCREPVPNELVRHREIVRALVINHVQMSSTIRELNRVNGRTQWLVILLSVLTLILGALQLLAAVRSIPSTPASTQETRNR